ncbi:MAG: RNA polymerase sigma-70 factor [Solirubrobacterales bacterium]|nr:RNA polymerase sigma-70 factor [Solirubrobacterales bacterium]
MAAETDDSLDTLRGYAFAVAYRMLGSVTDAEDIVQEGLLRMHQAEASGERIESRRAYLSTVVTRLAIDELRSARARRESYVGEWLPEPVVEASADPGPAERAEMADSLSVAVMVLLESLSPEQRAAFLLRDVFGYPYEEVAEIIDKSEPATRQLTARARKAVEARRPRFEASRERREQLADRFFAAAFEGEVDRLEELLAADVQLHGDGGGNVPAIARPLQGADRVARALGKWGQVGRSVDATARRVEVNGQPGALLLDGEGRIISAMALEIVDGRIEAVYSIVNPEKISHLGEVGDLRSMIRNRRR